MAHAEYIHCMMPSASIITSSSYDRTPVQVTDEELAKRQTDKVARKAIRDALKQRQAFGTLLTIHQLMESGLTAKDACDAVDITTRTRRNWLERYADEWEDWLKEQEMSKEIEGEKEPS